MRTAYTVIIFCLAAVPSWAGRPLETEDAYNVGRRSLELELGLEYADEPEECRQYGHGLAPTYGLTDAVDVALEFPVILSRTEGGEKAFGVGDVAARAKFRLLQANVLTLAVVPEVKFGTGNEARELGTGSSDVAALAAASLALGAATLHGNLGYSHAFPKDGEAEGCAFAALGAEVAAFGPVTLAAEFLAELSKEETENGDGKHPMAAGGGVSVAALENLALDAGVTLGFGAADGETAVTAGATWGVF